MSKADKWVWKWVAIMVGFGLFIGTWSAIYQAVTPVAP